MSLSITIDGTPVVVDIVSSTVTVDVDSPTPTLPVTINGTPVVINVESPTLIVDVESPTLLLPISGTGGGTGPLQAVWGETPTGSIDGINQNYTTASSYTSGLLAVFLNGLRQRRTADYIETGNQSFQFLNAPLSGDSLSIDYM
jgi:hypothetical protein